MSDLAEYVSFLKSKNFSSAEIRYAIDVRVNGVTMTKAIYKFNELYDLGEIDGFPQSAIEILEKYFGKNLKKQKTETLIEKVTVLQTTITDIIDEEEIKNSVEYYKN